MGSLLVYTCSAITLSLQGNTATLRNCSFFCLTKSAWYSVNLKLGKYYILFVASTFQTNFIPVKQVVNDVCLEYLDPLSVCHLLGVTLNLDVEGENDGVLLLVL